MKVVALASGGKDSCYNMVKCVQEGHELVALATLMPPDNVEESHSYMYQSVGVRHLGTVARAMELPLFSATIAGAALNTNARYEGTPGDEVEDLYALLKRVKDETGCEGVSSGAIFSDYQRVRVEHVCERLGLKSLAYLWHMDQKQLYDEMIASGVEAILIKVAGAGLVPQKHCGKSLKEMRDTLWGLNSRFGVHVCGEGGEFETFTLDCPLYRRRIVLKEHELVEESGDVGYLVIKELGLADK